MVPTAEAVGSSGRIRALIRSVPTASFLMPTAVGLVSIGLQLAGFDVLSAVTAVLAAAAFVVCASVVLIRWIGDSGSLRRDLAEPPAAFGLLSAVAAAAVLSTRAALTGMVVLPMIALGTVLLLWFVLGYLVPWTVLRAARGQDLTASVDAQWFLWPVTGQTVAILAAALHGTTVGNRADLLAIAAVVTWGVGLGMTIVVGTCVLLRVLRQGFSVGELSPSAWTVLAAVALSGLAASDLAALDGSAVSDAVRPLAAATAPLLWTFALWLLAPLLALGWWRHGVHGVSFRYENALWVMVLGLAAVAVAGFRLGLRGGVPVISWAGHTLLWAALGAALLVATAGMVQAVLNRPSTEPSPTTDEPSAPADGLPAAEEPATVSPR